MTSKAPSRQCKGRTHHARLCLPFAMTLLLACGRLGYDAVNFDVSAPSSPVAVTPTRLSSVSTSLLSGLNVSTGALVPNFSSDVLSYTVDVPFSTSTFSVTPLTTDLTSTITVNGGVVMTGLPSTPIALAVGSNPIAVEILRPDTMSQTYVIDVRRAASVPPVLSTLSVSQGLLSPSFTGAVFSYAVTVGYGTSSIAVTADTLEPGATLSVNGVSTALGTASSLIALALGDNAISILLTKSDGSQQSYAITVTRQSPVPPALSSLGLSAGTLVPAFDANTFSYTVDVASNISSVAVTPDTLSPLATLTVNGAPALFAIASNVNLMTGSNAITLVLTGPDTSTQTYTLNVNRAVSVPPPLSALLISVGALSPAFSASTFSYTVSVASNVSSAILTPSSAGNTITVNGQNVNSGTASQNIALATGDNLVNIVVTAPDTSTQSYAVTINRAVAVPPPLSSLSISAGSLSPAFASGTLSYSVSVASNITSMTVTPDTSVLGASITVNGQVVAGGAASQAINLVTGSNTITIVNTAPDTVTQTYVITVNRAVALPPPLSALGISSGSLLPAFASGTLSYTDDVGYATSSLTVTPTSSGNTITVNGAPVASGASSNPIALATGSNVITIVVTAPDTSTQTYTITVTRAAAVPPTLSNLTVSSGSLVPGFATSTLSYTVDVPFATTSINITPSSAATSIAVNGSAVASGNPAPVSGLSIGDNVVTIGLVAPDTSMQTYTVNVRRAASIPPRLSALSISVGALSPAFSSATFSYAANVSSTTSSIDILPTLQDPLASFTINGGGSSTVPLSTGDNAITVRITATDGSTQDYVVTVNRAAAPSLSVLSISSGTLSPAFASGTLSYADSVANTIASITVTPTLGTGASITVNGQAVTSGNASQAISLSVGVNTITIAVTDSFATTTNYTLDVTRAVGGSSPTLTSLALSTGSLSPVFDPGTLSYSTSIGFIAASISITPTSGNVTDTITVNGVAVTSGAPYSIALPNISPATNTINVVVTDIALNTTTYSIVVTRGTVAAVVSTYAKASIGNVQTNYNFGGSVAVDGDTAIVGLTGAAIAGSAFIFRRTAGVWAMEASFSGSGGGHLFGSSVAISGDTIAVGAPGEKSSATGINGVEGDTSMPTAGAVYVYTRAGTTWTREAYIKASNTQSGDNFGRAVAISADTLVVTATGEDSNATGIDGNQANNTATASGAAYVFTRSGSTWSQQAYLKASNTNANDAFGYAVAISGDTIAVSTQNEASSATGIDGNQADNTAATAGAVYIFTRSGATWSQAAYVKASNTNAGDAFGRSVSLSMDTLVVGAIFEDSNATGIDGNQADNSMSGSGAAYVFKRTGGIWAQQAYIKSSNSQTNDGFGSSVSISGDSIIIGAINEGSNATGINGDQTNNAAASSGAAYLFTRAGSSWSQQGYIKASNPDMADGFGTAVAVSADTIVVGALRESSNATGINGNQANNSVSGAGAAYLFR